MSNSRITLADVARTALTIDPKGCAAGGERRIAALRSAAEFLAETARFLDAYEPANLDDLESFMDQEAAHAKRVRIVLKDSQGSSVEPEIWMSDDDRFYEKQVLDERLVDIQTKGANGLLMHVPWWKTDSLREWLTERMKSANVKQTCSLCEKVRKAFSAAEVASFWEARRIEPISREGFRPLGRHRYFWFITTRAAEEFLARLRKMDSDRPHGTRDTSK